MDETEIVYCLDCENALCHVELCNVFREGVVLDQPAPSAPAGCF